MRRLWLLLTLLLAACGLASAQDVIGCYNGLAGLGGQNVFVNGIQAAQTVVVTYPGATVSVFNHGTLTLATIFADAAGTIPITQPWTASLTDASAFWCAADGFYDVQYSNAGIAVPFTISDIHIAFSSGGGGGGGGITTVTTAPGSGLTNSITGTNLTLAIASAGCPIGGTQIWNGTAFACGSASAWSSLTPPVANLNLPLSNAGIAYTSLFTCGDFGLAPTAGCLTFTTASTSTTDTTPVVKVTTGNNAFANPVFNVSLMTSGSEFAQFSVCNDGTNHLGFVAIGNSITCANLSTSPVSKFWSMDNSPGHVQATYYQNSTSASSPMLRLHTATPSASAPPFLVLCPSAVPNADGSCPSANYVGQWDGNGTLRSSNLLNMAGTGVVLNGVLITGAPLANYVLTATTPTAATWLPGGGGGGGGCTGAQWQMAYLSAVNTCSGFGPGLIGQIPVFQGTASPVAASEGVPGSIVAAGTYTVLCDSGTATRDRLTTIALTNAAPTITIPDPTDSGCGSNFTFTLLAQRAAGITATINRETSASFTTFTGSASATAQTTFQLHDGQSAQFNATSGTNYNVRIATGGAGGSSLWSGLGNPNANLTLTMAAFTSTFNHTSAVNWTFANTTAATLSTSQSSPIFNLNGRYWSGSDSLDSWTLQNIVSNGLNAASTLTLGHSGTSGTAAVSIPDLIVANSTQFFIPCAGGTGKFTYLNPSTSTFVLTSNGAGSCPTFQAASAGSFVFPITVSSAVSGGIPCFTSTTVMASSAILNANIVMKGKGAGVCPTNSSITDDGSTVTLGTGRLAFAGSAPTCTFTSGGGTTPSCTVDTGSTDSSGVIIMTTGTGSPTAGGTITLTFSATFGTNKPVCTYNASDAGAGSWATIVTLKDKTPSTASDLLGWQNGSGVGTALSASTAYWINYHCDAK